MQHGAVIDNTPQRWPIDSVYAHTCAALLAAGVPEQVAHMVADVLVDADVRGHFSHGVGLLPMYLDRVAQGGIDPLAEPKWLRQEGVVRVLSAQGGFGQVAAWQAARECATVGRQQGLAAVAVRDNNHVGMLAAYRQPFLDAGLVALILNISGPGVAAPGARKAAMGNNAVCLIAPTTDGAPLIADFATGTVASGKIRDAAARGQPVPDGWLVDAAGAPTRDPSALDAGGAVPVFGEYKGLCVSIITEVLAGMLAGATISPKVYKQRQYPARPMGSAQLFLGFSPDAFLAGDLTTLGAQLVTAIAGSYGDAPPLVYFPEQQEQQKVRDAHAHGLPLASSVAHVLGLVGTSETK